MTGRGLVVRSNANYNKIDLTIDGAGSDGAVVRGRGNQIDLVILGASGDGLRVEGGRDNVIQVTAPFNTVVLDSNSEYNLITGTCNGLSDDGTENDTTV